MTACPVVHRDGTVTIAGREVGWVFHDGCWVAAGDGYGHSAHSTRCDAVAALVRADEGTTDG